MSRKKLYEVERFSNVILDYIATSAFKDSTTIIDIGAGQGYLTHRLTTGHPCVAVDFDQIQTVGSKSRGNDIKRGKFKDSRADMKAKTKRTERNGILYKTAHINHETLTNLVHELEGDEDQCPLKDFMLVGLHACGDLSATAMLNTFQECVSVKMMAVVPCCFNLLSERDVFDHGECSQFESETTEPERGPSTFDNTQEGEPVAELCNPAIERKYHKFRLNNLSQEALKGPFVPYAMESLKCLGLEGKLSLDQVAAFAVSEKYQNAEKESFVIHCVRSLLSRVVESFLLIDRFLALSEMNDETESFEFDMLNLFDLEESPRNMVFLARRKE
ncbi:UNVERIFIED_CONTAM: hypothetical protein HDU68_005106 [Siphonaria sp. JEL0065]|nr:hypothetical protein HDU68_005106 [Siphonaria sp. JEL0065]